MGNFEKLSVVVIVVIIVMILVVALHTWTDRPDVSNEATDNSSLLVDERLDPGPLPPPPQDDDGGGPLPLPDHIRLQGPDPLPIPIPVPPAPEPRDDVPAAPVLTDYMVQAGETLGLIAQREYGSTRYVKAIQDANPGLGEFLRAGQVIKLPSKEDVLRGAATPAPDVLVNTDSRARPGGTYTTRSGDTWERISRLVFKTKERWPSIFALNSHLHDSAFTELPAGLEIKLPN
ncbi:MAG: tail protein X [Planctomycetota bacterium]